MNGNDSDDDFQFRINEKFAQSYESKKQREELSKLKDKYGSEALKDIDGDRLKKIAERKARWGVNEVDQDAIGFESEDEDTDEEEDENAELLTPEVDAQIMKTIAAIRTHDPRVYEADKQFFNDEEIEKAKSAWEQKQKQTGKKVTLKDYHRTTLLENGGVIDEDEEEEPKHVEKTHVQEQEEMKDDFKKAIMAADEEEEDGFFTKRDKTTQDLAAEEEDYKKFLLESMADNNAGKDAFADWQNYRDNPNVDKEEAFLIDYVLNRGWVDKNNAVPSYDEVVGEEDASEDEEYLDKVDRFESAYNFRFEEEGGAQLVSHAREIEGSVRKKDNRRKLQRQARSDRKEEEKQQKTEELKRLKNLKMKEIEERLRKIQEITGNKVVGIDSIDLDGDFDPDAYDNQMTQVFNDDYYTGDDNEKPTWDDDIDTGLEEAAEDQENVGDDYQEYEGAQEYEYPAAANPDDEDVMMDADYMPGGEFYGMDKPMTAKEKKAAKKDKKKKNKKGAVDEVEELVQAQEAIPESKKSTKRALDKYMEEYYNLDYEDMIGDLPTRFKYHKVDANNFGLSPVEILMADDKDLNQVAGLKVLAPFRPKEKQAKDKARFEKSKKHKLRDLRRKLKNTSWE
ncbi:Kinetochore protein Spc24 [Umbelopsis sp. WA50703]